MKKLTEKEYNVIVRTVHDLHNTLRKINSEPYSFMTDEKLDIIKRTIDHINEDKTTDESVHNIWLRGKQSRGWEYSYLYDKDAKTSPSMLPYDEITRHQKDKVAVIHSLISSLLFTLGDKNNGKK